MGNGVRLPKPSDRVSIIGRTGSGKTVAGIWHLSQQNFDCMPWIILDFKGDELINNIAGAQHITFDVIPEKPGIYILKPLPNQSAELDAYLWRVWERGHIGIYVDEGYMVGSSDAFNSILTQGRSLKIPVITLSQRPVWLSRFVFSESNFFQVFHLNDKEDRKSINRFVPAKLEGRLPEYHSYYYDVDKDNLTIFSPVPNGDAILEKIAAKMPKRSRTF